MSDGGRVCREPNAGAALGAGSIKMIGVLVGDYHFDLIFILATDPSSRKASPRQATHGLTQTGLKIISHRLTQTHANKSFLLPLSSEKKGSVGPCGSVAKI